jgi:uncharacterized protein (DUF433 family)
MPTFGINRPTTTLGFQGASINAIQSSNKANVSIPARTLNQTVFVELGDKPAKANISRDGYKVPSIIPDNNRLDNLLSGLPIVKPKTSPRVLGQSIAAGTRVSVGTTVDLVMAPSKDINIGIFDDVHVGLVQNNVSEILEKVSADTQIQDLVLRYDKADDMPAAQQQALADLLIQTIDIEIDDNKTGQSFGNAFNAMQVVFAFT